MNVVLIVLITLLLSMFGFGFGIGYDNSIITIFSFIGIFASIGAFFAITPMAEPITLTPIDLLVGVLIGNLLGIFAFLFGIEIGSCLERRCRNGRMYEHICAKK